LKQRLSCRKNGVLAGRNAIICRKNFKEASQKKKGWRKGVFLTGKGVRFNPRKKGGG